MINLYRSSCIVSFILVRFLSGLNFLDKFSKNPQISITKIPPVGTELFHVYGRT